MTSIETIPENAPKLSSDQKVLLLKSTLQSQYSTRKANYYILGHASIEVPSCNCRICDWEQKEHVDWFSESSLRLLCQQLVQFGALNSAISGVKTTNGKEHAVIKAPFNQQLKKPNQTKTKTNQAKKNPPKSKQTKIKTNPPRKKLQAATLVSTEQVR